MVSQTSSLGGTFRYYHVPGYRTELQDALDKVQVYYFDNQIDEYDKTAIRLERLYLTPIGYFNQ